MARLSPEHQGGDASTRRSGRISHANRTEGITMDRLDEITELADTMQAVMRMEDDFQDVLKRLPSIDELNELIDAMRTVIRLHDEMP
jgi:hypothetical protein